MAERLDRASPVVRRCAGFDSDKARLNLCEEGLDLGTAKLAAENLLSLSVDAVGVENVLSDIEADCDWLHHLTSSISCPKTIPVFGPGDGCRPQHQLRTFRVGQIHRLARVGAISVFDLVEDVPHGRSPDVGQKRRKRQRMRHPTHRSLPPPSREVRNISRAASIVSGTQQLVFSASV
jgi:hypothetical protein